MAVTSSPSKIPSKRFRNYARSSCRADIHVALSPSTNISRRSSACARHFSASAYSADPYHSRTRRIEGNSTITIRRPVAAPSTTCASAPRTMYFPPYFSIDAAARVRYSFADGSSSISTSEITYAAILFSPRGPRRSEAASRYAAAEELVERNGWASQQSREIGRCRVELAGANRIAERSRHRNAGRRHAAPFQHTPELIRRHAFILNGLAVRFAEGRSDVGQAVGLAIHGEPIALRRRLRARQRGGNPFGHVFTRHKTDASLTRAVYQRSALHRTGEQKRNQIHIKIVLKERMRDARLANQPLGREVPGRGGELRIRRRLDHTRVQDVLHTGAPGSVHDV